MIFILCSIRRQNNFVARLRLNDFLVQWILNVSNSNHFSLELSAPKYYMNHICWPRKQETNSNRKYFDRTVFSYFIFVILYKKKNYRRNDISLESHLSLTGNIDFSKVLGLGIKVSTWKFKISAIIIWNRLRHLCNISFALSLVTIPKNEVKVRDAETSIVNHVLKRDEQYKRLMQSNAPRLSKH